MNQRHLISSRQNSHFKRWVSLLDSHGIKRHRLCLVSGNKLRREIVTQPGVTTHEILLPPSWNSSDVLSPQAVHYELSHSLFQELDVFGTREPLLVCSVPEISHRDLSRAPNGLEVLCPIGDPGNLGALIRCCRAFDVQTVVLLQEAVHPFHPKVIRASSGAVFVQSLQWADSVTDLDTAETLRWITALDLQGTDLSAVKWPQHVRLLIGEEGVGVPPFQFAERLRIPQIHPAIPLNATVAGSIALYVYRQHHPQP
ncbi:MAG: RNA methyltransferase [Nitrospira sp.]|nr:RNA methyltransferase [Nitrospira sp.]